MNGCRHEAAVELDPDPRPALIAAVESCLDETGVVYFRMPDNAGLVVLIDLDTRVVVPVEDDGDWWYGITTPATGGGIVHGVKLLRALNRANSRSPVPVSCVDGRLRAATRLDPYLLNEDSLAAVFESLDVAWEILEEELTSAFGADVAAVMLDKDDDDEDEDDE